VKRGKADAEAPTGPTMGFVAVKTGDRRAVPTLHKSRDLLARQRAMRVDALRGTWPSSVLLRPEARAV
jgi:transposase